MTKTYQDGLIEGRQEVLGAIVAAIAPFQKKMEPEPSPETPTQEEEVFAGLDSHFSSSRVPRILQPPEIIDLFRIKASILIRQKRNEEEILKVLKAFFKDKRVVTLHTRICDLVAVYRSLKDGLKVSTKSAIWKLERDLGKIDTTRVEELTDQEIHEWIKDKNKTAKLYSLRGLIQEIDLRGKADETMKRTITTALGRSETLGSVPLITMLLHLAEALKTEYQIVQKKRT